MLMLLSFTTCLFFCCDPSSPGPSISNDVIRNAHHDYGQPAAIRSTSVCVLLPGCQGARGRRLDSTAPILLSKVRYVPDLAIPRSQGPPRKPESSCLLASHRNLPQPDAGTSSSLPHQARHLERLH
ncbi:uncharacterized protein BDZ83DRAFT_127741 [Colletotrichum acutatum]|uniref:Secreted protein n=1 Tax=Glomerella acutata TaxID=27357 RepID=A0AAD8UVG4_GLOAC|nr:uncharacterized protein BDZ83DRAFT_127741 [Colletotrichum acutatum]KAK1728434.1 hypothetical protein BDZ83DRAFT_127741 [Colletotrichum acutatum]